LEIVLDSLCECYWLYVAVPLMVMLKAEWPRAGSGVVRIDPLYFLARH